MDALFERNGFDPQRVYSPQGEYGLGQCRRPCTPDTWPSKHWIDNLLPKVDCNTQMLADQDLPRCPNCGGPTFFNIRCAHWFVEEPWEKGQRNWEHWLAQNRTNNIVAIDIDSGFNTPMWVRWPLEQITTLQPGNTLIRLNRDHPDVPAQIKAQSICFQEDHLDVLTKLIQHLH